MNHARRGTFILVCLALTTLAVALGFALLRNVGLQRDASQTIRHTLLAQNAAREGLAHATEQILVDASMENIEIGTGGGTRSVRAMTFLDGPYRAPFISIRAPNNNSPGSDMNQADIDKDVRHEHMLIFPWLYFSVGDPGGMREQWYPFDQPQVYDGRGRYIEPGYYNTTRVPSGPSPVATTSFIDPHAVLPERAAGLFFDERMRRIDTGNPVEDRKAARFRLRYAVGVEDLGGHLLMNPNAQMRVPEDGRNPPLWVRRGANAFGSIMSEMDGDGPWVTHWEHLFLGRGWFTNVDRNALGKPVTFPLMYRWTDSLSGTTPWSMAQHDGVSSTPRGLYASKYVPATAQGGKLLWADANVTRGGWHADGNAQQGRYANAQLGPQLSWYSIFFAHKGTSDDDGPFWGDPHLTSALFAVTPYGRAMRKPANLGDFDVATRRVALKWYHGRVDNPWYVNLLTTPPRVFSAMINGYLPPSFKWVNFQTIGFYRKGPNPGNPAQTIDILISTEQLDRWKPVNISRAGRDLFVRTANQDHAPMFPGDVATSADAIFDFAPPQRAPGDASDVVISPDYYKPDWYPLDLRSQDPKSLVFTYPGKEWNGDPGTQLDQGTDDLGRDINASNAINRDEQRIKLDANGDPIVGQYESKPKGVSYLHSDWRGTWYQSGRDSHIGGEMWRRGQGGSRTNKLRDCIKGDPTSVATLIDAATAGNAVTAAEYTACFDFSQIGLPDGVEPPADWWGLNPGPGNVRVPNPDHWGAKQGAWNPDSYWWDIASAMGQAVAITRAQWVMYDGNASPTGIFKPADRDASRYATLRDVDRLFLAHLGESLEHPGTDIPANLGLTYFPAVGYADEWQPISYQLGGTHAFVPEHNIFSLLTDKRLKPYDPAHPETKDPERIPLIAKRAALMELVLNDFRMSFLGSSPEYSDPVAFSGTNPFLDPDKEFRPLDFDGDGAVKCSCYLGGSAAAEAGGRGPKPGADRYFSLTGNFYIGKSHYFRIWSRGELYDNRTNATVQEALLETVVAADPEAKAYAREQDPTAPVGDIQVLYQRWMFDKYAGQLSRIRR